jgi:RNA polymerase sigma factor (sigma-70 family)
LSDALSQGDRYLLEQIRSGSADAWTQLVERYQGRLLSFARSRGGGHADHEDAVQEAFISFLKGLPQFRGDCSLETYLFAILNRKLINLHRGRRRTMSQQENGMAETHRRDAGAIPAADLASPDPTASWYARRDEEQAWQASVLREALVELIAHLKSSENFRDLQIVEMLFYCQLRNKDIAQAVGVRENQVGVLKHRVIDRIRQHVQRASARSGDRKGAVAGAAPLPHGRGSALFEPPDELLSRLWQEERLSCLKRSTIGAYLLGTLDEPWHDYVAFHLDRLGCQFCRANLEDLRAQTEVDTGSAFRDRIMQSTVGFLSRPSG